MRVAGFRWPSARSMAVDSVARDIFSGLVTTGAGRRNSEARQESEIPKRKGNSQLFRPIEEVLSSVAHLDILSNVRSVAAGRRRFSALGVQTPDVGDRR